MSIWIIAVILGGVTGVLGYMSIGYFTKKTYAARTNARPVHECFVALAWLASSFALVFGPQFILFTVESGASAIVQVIPAGMCVASAYLSWRRIKAKNNELFWELYERPKDFEKISDPSWNPSTEIVAFEIGMPGNVKIKCNVRFKDLQFFEDSKDASPIEVFAKNKANILRAAKARIEKGKFDDTRQLDLRKDEIVQAEA